LLEHGTSAHGHCAWINRLRDSGWESYTRVLALESDESLSKNHFSIIMGEGCKKDSCFIEYYGLRGREGRVRHFFLDSLASKTNN